MNISLVITVIGPDRPGIVSLLSERGQALGGNWAESHMASVAGQFAGIIHLQVPAENAEGLISSLRELEAQDLHMVIVRGDGTSMIEKRRVLRLEVVAQDRSGIIRDISRCLSDRGVSIRELYTEFSSGAWSAENLFKATAQLLIPTELKIETLRHDLETLGNDLIVDLTVDQQVAVTGSKK